MNIFFGKKKPEFYNGILMKADTNLHKQLADTIVGLKLQRKLLMSLYIKE